jgi:hypothetical protein
MKICKYCLIEKEVEEFPKTGLKCKKCVSIYKKNYATENKEIIKENQKIYFSENKEKLKEKRKTYLENNKEIIKEKRKTYLENNKEIIKDNLKSYYIDNKEKLIEYQKDYQKSNPRNEYLKKYRETNKESISEKRKEYYKENSDIINDKVKKYSKENRDIINNRNRTRKENDPLYRLKCSIRALITQSFKGQYTKKAKKTIEILGCDFETFKEHIESQFTNDMNWNNYASYWQLDHKTPISWSENEEDVYKLNHYTNFQPLFWKDNISKGNRWED